MKIRSSRHRRSTAATSAMPTGYRTMLTARRLITAALLSLAAASPLALIAPPAQASHSQLSVLEDDAHLHSDAAGTLLKLRRLGVAVVRVYVEWSAIAPSSNQFTRPNFDAANPAAYPQVNWAPYDTIVRDARADGIQVDFLVTGGAPFWATGPGIPPLGRNNHFAWRPSVSEFRNFVQAVGTRYSGRYGGLPAVRNWEIWNEPNFGEDLGPQAVSGSTVSVAPGMYRSLLGAAWSGLGATGHGRDTIVIGQLAARGLQGGVNAAHPEGLPGNFGQTKPLQFIRTLYCVDSSYRQLRGAAATARGCPATAAASRQFAAQNPGLFKASGFGLHPYPQNLPPTQERSRDPDFAAFSEIPNVERALDRLQRSYGSHRRLNIYNNEYGYVTSPPASGFASPATAAYYINWAEYLSWRDPRIATTMQYLLLDPPPGPSHFDSGLEFYTGAPKADYAAYQLPLYLPSSSARRGKSLEVWGDLRAAHIFPGVQRAQIQFQRGSRGAFTTLQTTSVRGLGYFDVRVVFPASGSVRVVWSPPGGATLTSRVTKVSVR
jgi:hypothetical protein